MSGIANPILSEQVIVGIKSEAVYGTIPSFTPATDFMYVSSFEPKITHTAVQRKYLRGDLLQNLEAPGSTLLDVTIKGEYETAAAAGSVYGPMNALELACGKSSTVSAGASVTYTVISSGLTNFPGPGTSCSIVGYYHGEQIQIKGVYGSMKETYKAGNIVEFEFVGKGLYTAMAHTAIVTPTFVENYVTVYSGILSVMSYSPEWSEVTFDYGVKVDAIPFGGDTYGFSRVIITDQVPTLVFNPLMDSVATFDPVTKLVSKANGSWSFQCGQVAGSIITYSGTKCQFQTVDVKDRDGLEAWEIKANVVGSYSKVIS